MTQSRLASKDRSLLIRVLYKAGLSLANLDDVERTLLQIRAKRALRRAVRRQQHMTRYPTSEFFDPPLETLYE